MFKCLHIFLRLVGPALLAGAALAAPPAAQAPLLEGLAQLELAIESPHPQARRYMAQGTLLVWGFNPEEAARSLEAAVAVDPHCASCWWTLAWALGPNINTDMIPAAEPRVHEALRQARRHAARAPAPMRGLIAALSLRHPRPGVVNETGYAQRLRELARRHPRDAEVAVLAAEALLNLHPYDWWERDGTRKPWTAEIERHLQRALALQPRHPGAHHYWIHLQESSPEPRRAAASADFLRDAVPGSAHLLHMPSHIDMRTGRYADAIRANQRSIEADERYLAQLEAQRAYRVGYVAHNHHFLWAAASMAGQQALALQAADAAWPAACGPLRRAPGSGIEMQYSVLPLFARVRFGQWRALLHDTAPPDGGGAYAQAIWHYARGTAAARLGQLDAAEREWQRLESLAGDPTLAALKVKNLNLARELVRIALLTLRADLHLARGQPQAALALLREATRIEDGFEYDEPHLWLAPTRHALGAALLAAGQAEQAAAVYRQDLQHYPDNGWSLHGLARALALQGQAVLAEQTAERARAAFALPQPPGVSRF